MMESALVKLFGPRETRRKSGAVEGQQRWRVLHALTTTRRAEVAEAERRPFMEIMSRG